MCRVLPNPPWPDWLAPLLKPICRFKWPSLARSWSSVNDLSFLSAILGPSLGPLYSGCNCVWIERKKFSYGFIGEKDVWFEIKTHYSSQRVKAQRDLSDVSSFEQVGGLENFFLWYSIFLDGSLESEEKYFTR